jgi:hypothetical protein
MVYDESITRTASGSTLTLAKSVRSVGVFAGGILPIIANNVSIELAKKAHTAGFAMSRRLYCEAGFAVGATAPRGTADHINARVSARASRSAPMAATDFRIEDQNNWLTVSV